MERHQILLFKRDADKLPGPTIRKRHYQQTFLIPAFELDLQIRSVTADALDVITLNLE